MIYEKSTLYKIDETPIKTLLHNELSNKELLIIIKQDIPLEPEMKEMLSKMTKALKLEEEHMEYFLLSGQTRVSDLAQKYEAKTVLCFGGEVQDFGIFLELKSYKLHPLDGFQLLMVNELIDIYNNQNLKGKLWNELKKIAKP